ncbi:hypothetical protein CO85_1259 [Staphylococcus aureus subsp. aureus CO-85]|nr:hypothetical protein CO85_1259 [Staphylococcus aureus subsp. aureus CO-85]
MSEPQKLHPISYFNGIINAIKTKHSRLFYFHYLSIERF